MQMILLVFLLGGMVLGGTVFAGLLIYLVARGSQEKTQWGVNLKPPTACPACTAPLPMVRAPKNLRQALWGGWTCAGCGIELDKWGRRLA